MWKKADASTWTVTAAACSGGKALPPPERTLPGRLTEAYLGCLFFGLPLALHQGFLDLMETKQLFFLATAIVYLLGLSVLCLMKRGRETRSVQGVPSPALGIADGCMAAFLLAAVLAWFLAGHTPADMMGVYNRYQGVLTWLLYSLLYWGVLKNPGYAKWSVYAALGGCCIVCLLAAANDFWLDPLHVYREIAAESQRRYASTLGNLNMVSSYLSLAIPALTVWWSMAGTRAETILTGMGLVCCGLGAASAGSESLALGLIVTAPLLPLALPDRRSIRRAILGILLFLVTLTVYGLAERAWDTRFYTPLFIRLLTRPYVFLPALALCGGALWLMPRVPHGKARALRRGCGFLLLALAVLSVCAVALINTVWWEVPLGRLDPFLRWSDGWGTDRGKIWTFSLEAFRGASPLQKLFGGGPGYLYRMDSLHPLFPDAATDTAHNEYLQYLLTCGILGLAAYLGLICALLWQAWRMRRTNPLFTVLFLGALGYAAQATVNIAQPAVTPLFFVMLALLRGYAGHAPLRKDGSPPGESRPIDARYL